MNRGCTAMENNPAAATRELPRRGNEDAAPATSFFPVSSSAPTVGRKILLPPPHSASALSVPGPGRHHGEKFLRIPGGAGGGPPQYSDQRTPSPARGPRHSGQEPRDNIIEHPVLVSSAVRALRGSRRKSGSVRELEQEERLQSRSPFDVPKLDLGTYTSPFANIASIHQHPRNNNNDQEEAPSEVEASMGMDHLHPEAAHRAQPLQLPRTNLIGGLLFGANGYYGAANAASIPLSERLKMYVALRVYYVRHIDCKEGTFELAFRQVRTMKKPPEMDRLLPLFRRRAADIGARLSQLSGVGSGIGARRTSCDMGNILGGAPKVDEQAGADESCEHVLKGINQTTSSPRVTGSTQETSDPRASPQPTRNAAPDIGSYVKPTRYYLSEEEQRTFDTEIPLPKELVFSNRLVDEGSVTYDEPFVHLKTGDVVQFVYGRITLDQSYDMHCFPFDSHKLALKLSNNFSGDQALFDLIVYAVDFEKGALLDPEFDLCVPELDRISPSQTTIYLPVQRYSFYYTLNFVIFLFFLNLIGLTGFAVAIEDVADRIAISATVALAAIAYKLFCSDVLPKINYNTALDVYILCSFFWIFLLNCYFAIASGGYYVGEGRTRRFRALRSLISSASGGASNYHEAEHDVGGDLLEGGADVAGAVDESLPLALLGVGAVGIAAGWPAARWACGRNWKVMTNEADDPYVLFLFCDGVYFLQEKLFGGSKEKVDA
eukprot:g8253.t1